MRIQAHVAVAMIDDDEQAIAFQPVSIGDPTMGDGVDFGAGLGGDQQAVADPAGTERGTESSEHGSGQRSRQAAAQFGERRSSDQLPGNVGEEVAQSRQQGVQALLIAGEGE